MYESRIPDWGAYHRHHEPMDFRFLQGKAATEQNSVNRSEKSQSSLGFYPTPEKQLRMGGRLLQTSDVCSGVSDRPRSILFTLKVIFILSNF